MPSKDDLSLSTLRLDLLPIQRSHAPEMFEVLNDINLREFTGGAPPESVDALRRRYELWEQRRSPDGSELWFNWAVRERQLDQLIGHMQAGVGAEFASVAWVIGSRWQGHGYASEAALCIVEWLAGLGVKDIRASIHPDHVVSIRVAERAGLERTELRSDHEDDEILWQLRVDRDLGRLLGRWARLE